jgi:hypothetical protein
MRKIIKKINEWLDDFAINRFKKLMPKEIITSLYRLVVERDLNITTKEINVKKGKRRYTLLVIKNKNLETVYNIGRHFT